jgi:hypothetical protein
MDVPTTFVRTAEDSPDPQEYVLALVDVLGFSERVRNSSLATLIGGYRQLLSSVAWSASVPVFHILAGRKTEWAIRHVIFSDSLLLWSRPDPECVDFLLTACARITAEAARIGWPLRGIVTVGECVIDQGAGLYVGEGIVRAVEGEKIQNWLGFGIDERAVNHAVIGDSIRRHPDFIEYPVPVKPNSPPLPAALKWKIYDPWAQSAVRTMMEAAPAPERSKYQATLDFLGLE